MTHCEEHKYKAFMVSCLCVEDHCPECAHQATGMDKEFLEMLKNLPK